MQEVELLHRWSPWLVAGQSPWEQVLHLGRKKNYQKNCIIIGSGELVKELHYLQTGKVSFLSANSCGEEKIVWYISQGNLFGEIVFFDGEKSSNYFVSDEDCTVYTFDKRTVMEKILLNYPDILENMLYTLSKKARILTGQINDLSLNTPKMRVYKMLYHLFASTRNKELCVSQQELASLLGIHRVTLNQILVSLKKQGVIQQDSRKRRIIVDNPAGLLRLIEEEQLL